RGLSVRGSFLNGFLAGMVFFTGAFWWVYVAMTTFAPVPAPLAVLLLGMLVGWCALHWGLAFGLTRFLVERNGCTLGAVLPPVWMASELMRNYFCSGFPWANLGYSQARNLWLSQLASVVGVYGIALVVALVNGAIYELLRAKLWRERSFPWVPVALAATALVAGHVYGAVRTARWDAKLKSAETVRVALVQGNIDQRIKGEQGSYVSLVLRAYNPPTTAADATGADLIIWPEAAFPRAFPTGSQSVQGFGLAQPSYRAYLLLGVDVFNPANMRWGNENAAFVVTPNLRVAYKYVKHHLVPFGEYVLFDLDKYLPIRNLVPGSFVPGKELKPVPIPAASLSAPGSPSAVKIGIEICFDAIFPEITRAYVQQGVDLRVNITNDAWYGFSSAPFQFLRMVAMRAIETGRPVARAANTGISAFIDPLGRITDATEIGVVDDERAVMAGRLAAPGWRVPPPPPPP